MDPFAAVSLASAVVQFVEFASRVSLRLKEFRENVQNLPDAFQAISAQLPLLIDALSRAEKQAEMQSISEQTKEALLVVFKGCWAQINVLDNIFARILPSNSDPLWRRGMKAYQSVRLEKRVDHIKTKLDGYIRTLTYHQTTQFSNLSPPMIDQKVDHYFEVPSWGISTFTGREDILSDIEYAFDVSSYSKPTIVVLIGMGGQGKTQIALEFCRRARGVDRAKAIFWIDASSEQSTRKDMEKIADCLTQYQRTEMDPNAKVRLAISTLATWPTSWLMVFDNYDDPDSFPTLRDYIPAGKSGAILITSRRADSERFGSVIDVLGMHDNEALDLLLKRSKLTATDDNAKHGLSIIEMLGFHPLAIDQAGAYIRKRRLPLEQFVSIYKSCKDLIFKETPKFWEYRRKLSNSEGDTVLNVFTTWELSYSQIDGLPDIRRWKEQFLTISAFLDYKSISSSIFQELSRHLLDERLDWIRLFDSGKDPYFSDLKFSDVIGELSDLSLVHSIRCHTTDTGYTQSYSLHPLVSDWLKLRISKEDRIAFTFQATSIIENFLASRVVGLEGRYYGFSFKVGGNLGPQILAHMQACEEKIRLYLNTTETLGVGPLESVGKLFAHFYRDRGRYLDALTLCDRIHKEKEAARGVNEPSVLRSAANLASLYRLQGNYEQAEQQIRTVLAMQQKVLGDEHDDSLTSATLLGEVLWDQGIFEEAEDISKKVLQLKTIVLGNEDPSTMISLSSVALITHAQGKLQEAEALTRQALSLRRKVLGELHPDTLHSSNHLIVILTTLGQFEDAEGLARENLRIRKDIFGDRHPNTATSLGNLAFTLQGQRRYAEAEEFFRQAMKIRQQILEPPFHPRILGGMEDLASILVEQGKLREVQQVQSEVSRLSALALQKTLHKSDAPHALAYRMGSSRRRGKPEVLVHPPSLSLHDIEMRFEYEGCRWK